MTTTSSPTLINMHLPPPPSHSVFVYNQFKPHINSTSGRFTLVFSKERAASVEASIALLTAIFGRENLSIRAVSPRGELVLIFDTFQSPHDAHLMVKRAAENAGLESVPENIRLHCLSGIRKVEDRRGWLLLEIAKAHAQGRGIHSIIINDASDMGIDLELIELLAAKYRCSVLVFLNDPPNKKGLAGKLVKRAERTLVINTKPMLPDGLAYLFSEVF